MVIGRLIEAGSYLDHYATNTAPDAIFPRP